jgi:hypothetical protein
MSYLPPKWSIPSDVEWIEINFDHDPVAGLDDRLEQFGGSIRWTDF